MNRREGDEVRLVVIILTINQKDKTLGCLESLSSGLPDFARILVWDNGSVDGTEEAINLEFPDVIVEHHQRNLGVASGRNRGAELAIRLFAPAYLLFLDNDMILTAGFIEGLMSPFLADGKEKVGQTQAKLLYMHEPDRLNDGGGCRLSFWLGKTDPVGHWEIDHGQYDVSRPCIACGGAMMVRTDIFENLGGFDTQFDPFGPEDLDFSLRLQKAGYISLYEPAAVAYHESSHTTGHDGYSERYAELRSRHWLVLLHRHASTLQKLSFFCFGAPFIAVRILVREGKKGNWEAVKGLVKGVLSFTNKQDRHNR